MNANWAKPDAAGTFGRVFFGSQGLMGMGGQVMICVRPHPILRLITFKNREIEPKKPGTAPRSPVKLNRSH